MKTKDDRLLATVRWMIRADLMECLEIEKASFDSPWTEEDFLVCLRQRNCIGMVSEYQGSSIGYMLYELFRDRLHVLNFAVDPQFRLCEIGRQMVEKLISKLGQQRRSEIVLEVRETNLAAQHFFYKCGFQATGVLRGHYEDTDEDAYAFRYMLNPSDCSDPMSPRRRW